MEEMEFPYENAFIRYSPLGGETKSTDEKQELFTVSCKSLRRFATPLDERLAELDDKLVQFVTDPTCFKHLLREQYAVVAGEFARNYLTGRESPNQLVIVTSQDGNEGGIHAGNIVAQLRDIDGYIICDDFPKRGENYDVCSSDVA